MKTNRRNPAVKRSPQLLPALFPRVASRVWSLVDKIKYRKRKKIYMRAYRARRAPGSVAQDARTRQIRKEKQAYIREYKANTGCVDCGEKDWIVLDLDHQDPLEKICDPNKLQTRSWANLKAELIKCVVRCANCHRRRTFREKHCRVRRGRTPAGL